MDARTTFRGAAVVVAMALLLPPTAAAQPHYPPDADLLVMLHYLVADGATPGIVMGILEAPGAPRVLSYGSGGPGAPPLGPGSVFEIGSITKTFTGTLLADMVARGEVALEDPVSVYLPPAVRVPSLGGREITLLDLATHRSGLPSLPDDFVPVDLADPYADYTVDRLYAFLSRHQLDRAPGAEAEYSNLGFGLLGHALGRAAGVSYRELLGERILEPLGMDRTGHVVDGEMAAWMTTGYKHGRAVPPWTTTEAFDGAGGLYSTAEDLLKYLAAHVGPPTTELERAMREAQRPRERFDDRWEVALGWWVKRSRDRTIVQHGGVSGGSSARIGFDPDQGVGFVRLTNTNAFPDDLGLSLLRSGPPLAVTQVDVPARILERYVGTYEFAPGVHFFVRLEPDGTLTTQGGPNTVRLRQYAESDSTFFLKRLPRRSAFRRDAAGVVDAMILDPDTRPRVMPKVSDDTPPPGIPRRQVLDLPLAPRDLVRYEGAYILDPDGRRLEARVYGEGGHLMARLVGGAVTRLLHQGDHVFLMDADTDNRVMFRVQGGRAQEITIQLGAAVIPGIRAP
jgi:serine-type D-Ala-D-Ala carboxypeptidase/endopeptidase